MKYRISNIGNLNKVSLFLFKKIKTRNFIKCLSHCSILMLSTHGYNWVKVLLNSESVIESWRFYAVLKAWLIFIATLK